MTKRLNRQNVIVPPKTSMTAHSEGLKVFGLGLIVLLILMAATAVARRWTMPTRPSSVAKSTLPSPPQAVADLRARKRFVERGRLQPQLQKAVQQLGDRVEKPGNERLVLSGVITRQG